MILFSKRQGVAWSTMLLAMEWRLQKKCASIEGVVELWVRLKAEKVGRDKWSLRSDLASIRLGDSVDTYVDKIQSIVDDFNLVSTVDQISNSEHAYYLLHGLPGIGPLSDTGERRGA